LPRFVTDGRRWADGILAVTVVAFATVIIVEAERLPPPFFDPLGSAAVPKFVAGVLIALAASLLWRCWRQPAAAVAIDGELDDAPASNAPAVAIGATVLPILYVGSMHAGILGFAPASAAFVWLLGTLLARGRWRTMALLIPLAIVVGYGLNALLTRFFYIDLPQNSFWTVAG